MSGKSGYFDTNKQDIQGAHIIGVEASGHITSIVGFPYQNGDEVAANVLANLRQAIDEVRGEKIGEPSSPAMQANTASDGFDI